MSRMMTTSNQALWAGLAFALIVHFFGALPGALAADIEVNGQNCTLAQAINSANKTQNAPVGSCTTGSAGADTLIINRPTNSLNLGSALPDINSDITIIGNGLTLDGQSNYRLFVVQSSGKLTLNNMKLQNGSAGNNDGGAILSSGSLTIVNSTLTSNSAANGGAIYASGGSVTIRGSGFTFNTASSHGGALDIQSNRVSLTISNSTIASNTATTAGGGISFAGGSATLSHVTLVDNISNSSTTSIPSGLYWWPSTVSPSFRLRNIIISSTDGNADCGFGSGNTPTQNVGNLIEDNSCSPDASGDPKYGTAAGDPVYYPLNSGSPALAIGDDAVCAQFPLDQRGIVRPSQSCDAGAAERDGFNYIYVDGNCTLNHAIKAANTNAPVSNSGCEKGFADDVATDEVILRRNVTLSALPQGVDSKMIVDGRGHSVTSSIETSLFKVNSGGGELTLRNITLTGARYQSDGGAVRNNGKLTMQNCIVKDNALTGANGGAIYASSSATSTTIDRCAFINNSASWTGGAITSNATLEISNSTFINNQANNGGAISIAGGQVTLEHLTVWNNSATISSNASAIAMSGGSVTLYNSIIGNSSASSQILCSGSANTSAGNLTWNGPETDNCGTVVVANPQLGALTGSPPFLPLGAGSAARGINNSGHATGCANQPIDQRGAARPATDCDIGAVQFFVPPADDDSAADLGPPKTGGRWVQYADGSWHYVRPGEDNADKTRPVCTGEALNESSLFKVSTNYGLCTGVQFNQLELSAIGIGYVVEAGPLAAIDVWGWVTSHVEVCYGGQVSALFLDAAASPRTVSRLDSIWDGAWTCAQISRAGTIVFMPAQSYLTTAPVNAPDSPPPATPLADCMAQLNYILNFRETPGGAVMRILPYAVRLTAFQRTADWVEVDWYGARGWVSAHHVTFEGTC